MVTLIVVGGIIGYFLIGAVIAGVVRDTVNNVNEFEAVGLAILWPLAVFGFLMMALIEIVTTLLLERRG